MTKEIDINRHIPFGKAVRVGNFKLWRGCYVIKSAEGNSDIECIHISTVDGAWMVRIPATFEMYGMIAAMYYDWSGDDGEKKSHAEFALHTVFANIMYSSAIGNGYYQRGLELVATLYAHPTLLSKKDKQHKQLLKDVKGLVAEFLEWRKGYDAEVKANEPTEQDLHQDELAEQAMEVLEETGETPLN